MKDVHYKTCWKIYAVNRVFIIINSRYDCGIRKNTNDTNIVKLTLHDTCRYMKLSMDYCCVRGETPLNYLQYAHSREI